MTSIDPPPHTPYDWEDFEARRAERDGRVRISGGREISPRSRRIVGAILLIGLIALLAFGIPAWIDYIGRGGG